MCFESRELNSTIQSASSYEPMVKVKCCRTTFQCDWEGYGLGSLGICLDYDSMIAHPDYGRVTGY